MFHDILDYQNQNDDFNIINEEYKGDHDIKTKFKNCRLNNNYFGKGNYAVDEFNRKKEEYEFENKFEKTKNKIKLVVYKNGFILNNGSFRDRAIKENHEFLKSVEKGNIPDEFIKKGIYDLGILLINRRGEMYRSKLYKSLPTSFDYINISLDPKKLKQNEKDKKDKISEEKEPRDKSTHRSRKKIEKIQKDEIERLSFSSSKQRSTKPFIPFKGKGRMLAYANIGGFHVDKRVKNFVDFLSPACSISIILFNGEVIEDKFNYYQTLRDIYLYVRRVTGSNNFVLLNGVPPKALNDYEKTIEELDLENTFLTQKINIL